MCVRVCVCMCVLGGFCFLAGEGEKEKKIKEEKKEEENEELISQRKKKILKKKKYHNDTLCCAEDSLVTEGNVSQTDVCLTTQNVFLAFVSS